MKTNHPYTCERVDKMLRSYSIVSLIVIALYTVCFIMVGGFYFYCNPSMSTAFKIESALIFFIIIGILLIPEVTGYMVEKNPSAIRISLISYIAIGSLVIILSLVQNKLEIFTSAFPVYYIIRIICGFQIQKWVNLGMPYEQPVYNH